MQDLGISRSFLTLFFHPFNCEQFQIKNIIIFSASGTVSETFQGESLAAEGSSDGNFELMPPQIREQMIRLGAENKRLKEQYDREMAHVNESKDEMNETIQKLMEEKNQLNERITQLEQVFFDLKVIFSKIVSNPNQISRV